MAEQKTPQPAASPAPKSILTPPGRRRAVPSRFYASIAQLSALLLVGQLAMTTFLLSAGLQHPKLAFVILFYATLASLGLNLVLFAIGALLGEDGPSTQLTPFRYIQHGVFILSIIVLIGFATTASLLFFGPISSQTAVPAGAASSAASY